MPTVESIYLRGLQAIIEREEAAEPSPDRDAIIRNCKVAIERYWNHGLNEPIVEVPLPHVLLKAEA